MWKPGNTQEHAADFLAALNALLVAKGVKDSEGNQVQIEASSASILWLLALAEGQMRADMDATVQRAIDALDLKECPPDRLEALQPLMGYLRGSGAPTRIFARVTNPSDDIVNILQTDSAEVNGETGWHIILDSVRITAGATETVELAAPESGTRPSITTSSPVVWTVENVTLTPITISNIEQGHLWNDPIYLIETYLNNNMSKRTLLGIETVLESVAGVEEARVFFNESTMEQLVSGGFTIQPRCCALVLKTNAVVPAEDVYYAWWNNIAITTFYFAEADVDTVTIQPSGESWRGLSLQYTPASPALFGVKVFYEQAGILPGSTVKEIVKQVLTEAAPKFRIAQAVSSADIAAIVAPIKDVHVTHVMLYDIASGGTHGADVSNITPLAYQYPVLSLANADIVVEEEV